MFNNRDKRAKYTYLGILTTTLGEYDKSLNALIERINTLAEKMLKLLGQVYPSENIGNKTMNDKLTQENEQLDDILQAARDALFKKGVNNYSP